MKIHIFSFLIILSFLLTIACSDETKHIREAQRLIEINRDSTLMALAQVANPEKLPLDERMSYVFLNGLTHWQNSESMADDSLMIPALHYFKEREMMKELPHAYAMVAEYHRWNNRPDSSRSVLNDGIRYFEAKNDTTGLFRMHYEWIQISLSTYTRYTEAIEHGKQCLELSPAARAQLYYLIGICFSRMNQKDSAGYYMEQSVEHSTVEGRKKQLSHYRRNYADLLQGIQQPEKALRLLTQNLVELQDTGWLSLAHCYLDLGKFDSAQYYLDELRKDNRELYITVQNSANATQLLLDYIHKKPLNWSKIGLYNDSLAFDEAEKKALYKEKQEQKELLTQRNLRLQIREQRMQLYLMWGLLSFVVVLIGILYVVQQKRKRMIELHEKQDVLERMLKEAMLADSERDSLARKVILRQLGFIRSVANMPTQQNQELLKCFSRIGDTHVSDNDLVVWDDLYKLIDSVYDSFYTKLLGEYESVLSEKEIQLCCLLRADFSTKEISVLTGQKMQTIYQRKTTIRQRLCLDEKIDIIEGLRL
ncbi:MAG: tetratricopeptide repeat protein [Tannerellaceae bacterium]